MSVAAILKEKGSEVATADAEMSLLDVAQLLTDLRIGATVIAGEDGQILGIISERDLVKAVVSHGPSALDQPVKDHMTRKVVTCSRSDTVGELMASMTVGKFRHLPVVEDGKLVGIVSIGDIVKQRIAEAEMEADAMRAYIATG